MYVSKKFTRTHRSKGMEVIFAVIDLDKSEKYPENFVCLLPKRINLRLKHQNKFVELFKKESLTVAKGLLTKLLGSEEDPDIRKAIREKLRLLDSRSAVNF